ncbi:death domain-associated protein 6 [Salarias fasciatus]|uniref:Death domain-associated protein 6 n=1 Tax=Salarias fasciatus TaxID=181472 RepID=A0A672I308_SALFA|nr:death domain-associated protein 6 [Salarias fasciatus]
MADNIIILEDDEESPPATASVSSAKTVSPLKAQLPVATHITQSPFASAKKQKHVLQAENQKLFSEFLEHCSALTTDCPEVLTFLQNKHDKACPDFLSSVEFRNTLGRCLTRAQANHSKTFVYINELCTVLRQHGAKKRQTLTKVQPGSSTSPANTLQATSVSLKSGGKTDEEGEASKRTAEEEQASTSGLQEDTDQNEKKAKRASRKQIAYLENLLKVYNDEIYRLQQAELSLDELAAEDSLYIQEHKLKRKMMKIYEKLCDLKGCSTLTGRVIEQNIPYTGTRYPEINKKIQRFINSPEARVNPPDYQDILQQVLRANERHNLCLPRKQLNQIAQEAFRETGSRMQERRHLDLVYNFGSHLTDQYKIATDPALSNPSLMHKLRSNRETAMSRLEEVINKFAVKQDDTEEQERCRRQERDGREGRKTEQVNGKEEDDDEEEEDDEDDESSDPDIEEEIQASAQQGGEDDDVEDEESNEAESARAGTDKDDQTDDQTGSLSADEEESGKDEEPVTSMLSPVSEGANVSPLSDPPSPRESPSQSEAALPNGDAWGARRPADSSNHGPAEHTGAAPDANGDAEPPPSPPPPSVTVEECDTQTSNGKPSPPSSPRATRSQKRKREQSLSKSSQISGTTIIRDTEVDIPLDMGVFSCGSPQRVESTRADTPPQDVVSSSEPLPKRMKVSVGTQCDPEEIIVLSDSE